jgi:hypothetical protein
MKIHTWSSAIAAGLVTAAFFSLCVLFVAVAPEGSREFFGYLFHIDLSPLAARPIGLGSFLAGLFASGLGMGLAVGIAASLYNRLVR